MKWLWITALLFLVTEVKSGPTRKDGMLDVLGISKIERDDQGAFIFTLNTTTSVNTTHSILVVRVIDHEYGFRSENSTPSTLLTFKADLTQFSGSDVEFMILVKNKAEEDVGAATLDIHFPDFPGGTTTQNLFDPRDLEPDIKKKKILLRVAGSLGDMRPQTGESLIIGDINYFAFPNISSVDYVPWNKSNGVDVCDKELDQPETTGTVIGPTVSSAVLAYGPKPNATIKLSFLNAEEIQDAILIPQLSNSFERNVLCTLKQFDEETCTIDWSDQGYTGLRLIITQKTTGTAPDLDTWETYSFDIHDRELVATQLGADIIEGRWLMLGGEYSADQTGKSVYRLRKSAFGENLPQDIDVDCSHLSLEPKLCFGYFPHLVKDKTYTLTVAYKESDKANEMDQIESSPVKIKASEPELEILSRHTTTHRNQQKADVQICFQHLTPTEGRSFSHYEMLIINEKGQWLKHRIMQEEEEEEEEGDASEERLCFAPFTISTKDFDLTEGTKVVVSQRAVDEVSVLASGESALF